MRTHPRFTFCAALGGAVAAGLAFSPPVTAAKAPISFSSAQADAGRLTFYAKCAMCHGANLEGISGPALKGKDANLQEQTVSAVYTYTKTEMPVGNAGGLSKKEYVDLIAFLLKSNGRRASQKDLTTAALLADTSKIGGPK